MFKECCWFLYGIKVNNIYIGIKKYHSKGDFGSVSFNWKEALNKYLLGWSHTHPGGEPYPSERDDATMSGWVIGTGRPLLCDIISNGYNKCWVYGKRYSYYRKDAKILKHEIELNYYGNIFIAKEV